jgi:hypothetical protein
LFCQSYFVIIDLGKVNLQWISQVNFCQKYLTCGSRLYLCERLCKTNGMVLKLTIKTNLNKMQNLIVFWQWDPKLLYLTFS